MASPTPLLAPGCDPTGQGSPVAAGGGDSRVEGDTGAYWGGTACPVLTRAVCFLLRVRKQKALADS